MSGSRPGELRAATGADLLWQLERGKRRAARPGGGRDGEPVAADSGARGGSGKPAPRGSGRRLDRLRQQGAFLAAAAAALAIHLWLGLRNSGGGSRMPAGDGGVVLALHPEWSNRTRWAASALLPGPDVRAILLLGRPRGGIARFEGG